MNVLLRIQEECFINDKTSALLRISKMNALSRIMQDKCFLMDSVGGTLLLGGYKMDALPKICKMNSLLGIIDMNGSLNITKMEALSKTIKINNC